ncbi:MAG: 30S ribosomal protein S4 [Methylacidiphilales bacterium]|nr:30S ribosomal protein S4 [Candidatus Methylacidiphilales bacterium]
MARYLGPSCRLSRREGVDLEFKSGLRSIESKCRFSKLPGRFSEQKTKPSEYCTQLREKQKLKRTYGLLERQFSIYYKKSLKLKGNTGENIFKMLEQRLDNVVYRMGFATTRAEARQLVSHRLILINNNYVTIPSFQVKAGDIVKIKQTAQSQSRIKTSLDLVVNKGIPEWLEVDKGKYSGVFLRSPNRSELSSDINESLIIELYSK